MAEEVQPGSLKEQTPSKIITGCWVPWSHRRKWLNKSSGDDREASSNVQVDIVEEIKKQGDKQEND